MITLTGAFLAASLAVTGGALAWAAASDVRFYTIPNRIPVIIVVAFAVAAFVMPSSFVIGGVVTGMAAFVVGGLLFGFGLMGGGDAKLMAAVAFWSGPSLIARFALVMALAGLALAIFLLTPGRRLLPAPSEAAHALATGGAAVARQPMPFGVAIAIGGFSVLAQYLRLIR
jgi:prepilin peptidase CpaA